MRKSALQDSSDSSAVAQVASGPGGPVQGSDGSRSAPLSPRGDPSKFHEITQDTLDLLNGGNQSGATNRVDDLEIEWDNAGARLKPKDKAAWTAVDGKIDTVLRELRATSPTPNSEKTALTALLDALG